MHRVFATVRSLRVGIGRTRRQVAARLKADFFAFVQHTRAGIAGMRENAMQKRQTRRDFIASVAFWKIWRLETGWRRLRKNTISRRNRRLRLLNSRRVFKASMAAAGCRAWLAEAMDRMAARSEHRRLDLARKAVTQWRVFVLRQRCRAAHPHQVNSIPQPHRQAVGSRDQIGIASEEKTLPYAAARTSNLFVRAKPRIPDFLLQGYDFSSLHSNSSVPLPLDVICSSTFNQSNRYDSASSSQRCTKATTDALFTGSHPSLSGGDEASQPENNGNLSLAWEIINFVAEMQEKMREIP